MAFEFQVSEWVIFDGQVGGITQGWGNWGWDMDVDEKYQGEPKAPKGYALKATQRKINDGGVSLAASNDGGHARGGKVVFWAAGDPNFAVWVRPANPDNPEFDRLCRRNMTTICGGPLNNNTYTRCELDLSPCPQNYDYNRVTFGQIDVLPLYYQTLYLTDVSWTSYQRPPEIATQLHIGIAALSLAISAVATISGLIYITYLQLRLSKVEDTILGQAIKGRRNVLLQFTFAMFLLMISDVFSVLTNAKSNGVMTDDDEVNRFGQAAMAFQLGAISVHLINRILMFKAFQPITWYPRWIQVALMCISAALPLGAAVYVLYLVMQTPTAWGTSRLVVLLSAIAWSLILDISLTVASFILLFKVRQRLKQSGSIDDYAAKHSKIMVGSLFFTMLLALFLASYCIYAWDEHPYVGQLAIRLYFLGYLHYLVTLRQIMQARRDVSRDSGWSGSYRSNRDSGATLAMEGASNNRYSSTKNILVVDAAEGSAASTGTVLPAYDFENRPPSSLIRLSAIGRPQSSYIDTPRSSSPRSPGSPTSLSSYNRNSLVGSDDGGSTSYRHR